MSGGKRVEMLLGDKLIVSFDVFDFSGIEPFVSLTFHATGENLTMPAFSVGLPFDLWAQFQAMVAVYDPAIMETH